MTDQIVLPARKPHDPAMDQVIKLAVMAVGGQGGGVLTNWIEDCGRLNGYAVQATSVAGVAQRTGATIYYVEMAPDTGRLPIFALSPAQGDVDVLIAAELMEAGRAIMRGFVTPERTTLIASSHRIAAVSEKIEPGDGRASSPKVVEAAEAASLRFISFDMEQIAVENGTMISASLLGALAGSGALPFTRESFEAAIKAGGRGADASLAAFGAAYDRARGMASKEAVSIPPHPASAPLGHPLPAGERRSSTLVHIEAGLPPSLALSVQSSSPRRGEGGRAERRPGEGALRKEQ